jgi:uncharacterized protein (TIGR01777 family)
MKIAITGSTGFIGGRLTKHLQSQGHEILPLGRKQLSLGELELASFLEGCDAIINLAGAPILGRHTSQYKKIIYDSRVDTTNHLVKSIKFMNRRPASLISASAIGIYSGKSVSTESSPEYADDFVAKVCKDWEAAANNASGYTTVCIPRMGVVLDNKEGALAKMLLPFKLGLGAKIGNGQQMFSWIHIDDLLEAYTYLLASKPEGVYNLTSPGFLTNKAYTRALAKTLHKPALLVIPPPALRLLYGGGAETLTSGQAVYPERLLNEGFEFKHPILEKALEDLLTRNK